MHCRLMDVLHGFEAHSTTEETHLKLLMHAQARFCAGTNSIGYLASYYLSENLQYYRLYGQVP